MPACTLTDAHDLVTVVGAQRAGPMLHFAVPRSGHPDSSIPGEASAKETPQTCPPWDPAQQSVLARGDVVIYERDIAYIEPRMVIPAQIGHVPGS